MIHTRGTHSNDGEIVMTQLLQGIGGGFGTLAITVAAQASVPHADIAVTTAILILWSEVGSAVGDFRSPSALRERLSSVPKLVTIKAVRW